MDVLVFTPTYGGLMRQEMEDSLLSQNTRLAWEWVVSEHNPFPVRDMKNVCAQFERGRQLFLDFGADSVLFLEHDMVMPEDCMQTLYDTDAPVVYSAYMLRHGTRMLSLFQVTGGKNIGMSLSLHPADLKAMRKRGWGEVSGVGFGCTLVRRPVFEEIRIQHSDHAPDIPFAQECLAKGFRQVGRLDVACGHITEYGEILDPAKDYGMESKVKALTSLNVQAGGVHMHMDEGETYIIPYDDAFELARAGYVEIADDVEQASARETATAPVTARKPKPKRKPRRRKAASRDTD